MVFSVLPKGRDQIITLEAFTDFLILSCLGSTLIYLINTEVHTCLMYNCCLHSVHILEHNVKRSLLPLGILCSRWTRPGRGHKPGGCREGTALFTAHIILHNCYSVSLMLTEWGVGNSHLHSISDSLWVNITAGVDMGEYEHAMDTIHASVQGSPVALLGVRIPAVLSVGWSVVCTVGCWTVESGAKRLANGFFNSAEQPFAKACRTTVLLSRGLQQAAHSDRWREAADTQPPPSPDKTHTHALSPCYIFSLNVWSVSIVTPLRSPFIVSDQICWPV